MNKRSLQCLYSHLHSDLTDLLYHVMDYIKEHYKKCSSYQGDKIIWMESSSFVLLCCTDPQNAPSEVDGVNLEEIREFAKAFKIRRLSLGLTQTQVGQALSATEGPAYSQSAICRYGGLTAIRYTQG